jgi:hypothetical protein
MDPWPLMLSERVTIFAISAPWKPEPRSLIVPSEAVEIAGKTRLAGELVWMEAPEELTEVGRKETSAKPTNAERIAAFGDSPSFVEVAFYDRPFCFCKPVRTN